MLSSGSTASSTKKNPLSRLVPKKQQQKKTNECDAFHGQGRGPVGQVNDATLTRLFFCCFFFFFSLCGASAGVRRGKVAPTFSWSKKWSTAFFFFGFFSRPKASFVRRPPSASWPLKSSEKKNKSFFGVLSKVDKVFLGFDVDGIDWNEFYWVILGFYSVLLGFIWFYLISLCFTWFWRGFNWFIWNLLGSTGFLLDVDLIDLNGFSWVILGFIWFYLISLCFTWFYLVLTWI